MAECKRKLKKVNVQFISLVGQGANGKAILWKSADASDNPAYEKTISILKTNDEQRLVYGIVYSPNEVDSQGDTATADVIKDMAYGFMKSRNTLSVDKDHNGMSSEGFVAESWIVKKKDSVFTDQPEGSWAVAIKVENDTTWNAVKSGEIGGLSLAGLAEIEEVTKADEKSEETQGTGIIQKIRQLLKIDGDKEPIIKAGKAISAANMARIKAAVEVLTEIINAGGMPMSASGDEEEIEMKKTDEPSPPPIKETHMTPDEVGKVTADAVKPLADALKSLEEKMDSIEKAQNEASEKIEKVSKETDGSNQLKVNEKKIEKIWT